MVKREQLSIQKHHNIPQAKPMKDKTTMAGTQKSPNWSDIKRQLTDLDQADLIRLVHDLYSASKENKVFLHTRFAPGGDPLEPWQDIITRWINPPDFRAPISVAKAKKAISDYKKAKGDAAGLAELSVFYCEEVFDFLDSCGMEDADYYDALVRMFGQALQYVQALPASQQKGFFPRLGRMHQLGQQLGWGVGEDFDDLWHQAGLKNLP